MCTVIIAAGRHGFESAYATKDVNPSLSNSYQAALNAEVPLPGGFSTTRREVLKLGSLAIGLGSAYFSATHLKVWCFRSCLGRIREFRS